MSVKMIVLTKDIGNVISSICTVTYLIIMVAIPP